MTAVPATALAPPWTLASASGLRAVLVDGGAPASMTADGLELVQHAASSFEAGLLGTWLRDRGSGAVLPLVGAGSGSRVSVRDRTAVLDGEQDGLAWRVTFALADEAPAWAWHVEVRNAGDAPREVDLVHAHDVALAAPGALRANELYVSQYLELRPVPGDEAALAVRQNLAQDGRHPWCVLVATDPPAGWATDLLDAGWADRAARRAGPTGDLPARRRQHEHTLAALQGAAVVLSPGAVHRTSFAGLLVADHPEPTSEADARHAAAARDLARRDAPWGSDDDRAGRDQPGDGRAAPSGVYCPGRELVTRDLTDAEVTARWPGGRRAHETADGASLSFFTADDEHVVLRAKELVTLRPHGTILRTGGAAVPDPEGLAVTAWMSGSPLSYLTRGHASEGRVLTTVRGYLGQHAAYGARVLIEVSGRWRLLALPSAFAMRLDGARWVHTFAAVGPDPGGTVEVRTTAPAGEHRVRLEVRTTAGPGRRVLVALHLASPEDPLPARAPAPLQVHERGLAVDVRRGGRTLRLAVDADAPVTVARDGVLHDDGTDRDPATVTLVADGPVSLDLRVDDAAGTSAGTAVGTPVGEAAGEPVHAWWPRMTALRVAGPPDVEPLAVALPWLVRDALVHHLSPRGLEQYTGGAWGTRDVTQGPLELLLALDRAEDARALLLTVLRAQSSDGSWPQAFGFLPGDEGFRHEPPHADVVHWPVLALGRYLEATGDAALLDAEVRWWAPPGAEPPPPATVREHVRRALAAARAGYLPGTALVAYGHGDWNDSLQPADPAAAAAMTSAWTVTLHHQALRTLASGLRAAGTDDDLAAALEDEAAAVAADLHRHLVVDGELAGYAELDPPDGVRGPHVRRLLVHPRDEETGLRHGALPIIHALGADLLAPDAAAHHVTVVREHLTGVDGVRLFDRPPRYAGGTMRHFQRAETATFVGREIGLMYVHAHLRWCEAMARRGDADALWHGLLQVLPAAAAATVPGARPRQANTYPSSSDAACLHREEFAARYPDVLTGATGLEAGWRVYSSGPGVLVRVVAQSLLGVRRRASAVEVDPVLPRRLDGLRAAVPLGDALLRVRYRVGARGHGATALRLAGRTLDAVPTANPYRAGGLRVPLADLAEALAPGGPELEVDVP